MYTVTVMPNKNSIYFPATLGLRSRGIKSLVETEVSMTKIIFSLAIDNTNVVNGLKLHFDKKNPSRQHAILKQKRLVKFMESVYEKNKWDCYIENNQLILEPSL